MINEQIRDREVRVDWRQTDSSLELCHQEMLMKLAEEAELDLG